MLHRCHMSQNRIKTGDGGRIEVTLRFQMKKKIHSLNDNYTGPQNFGFYQMTNEFGWLTPCIKSVFDWHELYFAVLPDLHFLGRKLHFWISFQTLNFLNNKKRKWNCRKFARKIIKIGSRDILSEQKFFEIFFKFIFLFF